MAAEASNEDHRQQRTAIDLSPAAKKRIILALRTGRSRRQLSLAGADYAYLVKNRGFFASPDGQRYLHSDELRMTLEALLTGSYEAVLEAAFDESREQLVFRGTFPHPGFIKNLVEKFVTSEHPRSVRRVLLISEEDLHEATSASFHLPQAYDTSFPCTFCTGHRTVNETYSMFVEVFHFANRNDPSVCATVSFRMSVLHFTDNITTSDSRVEVCLTESCRPQRAPFARPSRKLFTHFDTFYAVLREVNPDGFEKLQAVSQSWHATIARHKRALARRNLIVNMKFNGEDPTIVTAVISRSNGECEQVQRVLVPRSPVQLSWMLRDHLRDALVSFRFISWERSFRLPPQDAMLRCDQSKALGWTIRLLQSLKRTHVKIAQLHSELFGIDNLPVVMNAVRFSCRVGTLDLIRLAWDDAFTVRQIVDLLRDPTAAAVDKISVGTCMPTSTDYSTLEDLLFSRATPAFELRLSSSEDMPLPPTTILTLPARFIQRFLDAKNTSNVIGDFYLVLGNFANAAFVDLPPTNRTKQSRHNRYGEEVTTRVRLYRNTHTGEVLAAVRQVDLTYISIHFLKGHIALDDLRKKWTC